MRNLNFIACCRIPSPGPPTWIARIVSLCLTLSLSSCAGSALQVPPSESWQFLSMNGTYDNGQLMAKGDYESLGDGLFHGKWLYYYENGRKKAEAQYHPDGWDVDVVLLRRDGSKSARGRLRSVLRDWGMTSYRPIGSWVYWTADGQRYTKHYDPDARDDR